MKIIKINQYKFEKLIEIFNVEGTILLESQETDISRYNQYSFLCIKPLFSIKQENAYSVNTNTLKTIDEILSKYKTPNLDTRFPFVGGFAGYISYDYKETILSINSDKKSPTKLPAIYFNFYESVIIYCLESKEIYLSSLEIEHDVDFYVNLIDHTYQKYTRNTCSTKKEECKAITQNSLTSENKYLKDLELVHEEIRNGNVYQINYTYPVTGTLNNDNHISLYKRLKRINPAAFAAFIKDKNFSVCSSSPERFIKICNSKVSVCPIKGTINKTADESINRRNVSRLANSEKDKSELLMIVDLERNDLGILCETGSINVHRLFDIEEYPTLYHLVSEVEGTIKANIKFENIVKSVFPGGSITGLTKISAMKVIDKLEEYKRGLYTGSIGYININGNMDFSIVIRTIVLEGTRYTYNVGGGIVWDSDNKYEFEECSWKAKALLEALNSV